MARNKNSITFYSIYKWVLKYWWEIAVFCAGLFLILAIFFADSIAKWEKYEVIWEPISRLIHENIYVSPLHAKTKVIHKKYENECRRIFESIFGRSFPTVRPHFMRRSSTGKCLEIDGLCKDINLGFEYNGVQHSKYSPYFHRTYQDFLDQQQRDHEKRELCKQVGITLIEIPHTVKFSDLERYIRKQLIEKKISL